MPHSCAVCGALYESLGELENGACPVCHACKFIYEAPRNVTSIPVGSLFEENSKESASKYQDQAAEGTGNESNLDQDDEAVSVRIKRPGKYEINLRQMVESPDRIIGVKEKGVYHLDLHSMVGKRKHR